MAKEKKLSSHLEKGWEIKDRTYYVKGNRQPLTLTIPSRHGKRYPLTWFDEETGGQRELRYATNMSSPFVDEQKGEATLGHIMFKDGTLTVGKKHQALQKLLSLYHPLKGKKYEEVNAVQDAADELDYWQMEIEALNAASQMDIDMAEAILRVEVGSKVSKLTSKEVRRDLILFAKKNPQLLLELLNDENIQLRNFAIKATEAKIIKLSQDQRTFTWASNGKKLMTIPFDENPYSAMAAFFKTDEGVEIYKSIEKKFK